MSELKDLNKDAERTLRIAMNRGYTKGVNDAIETVKRLFQIAPDNELFNGDYVEDIINLHSYAEIKQAVDEFNYLIDKKCMTCKYGDEPCYRDCDRDYSGFEPKEQKKPKFCIECKYKGSFFCDECEDKSKWTQQGLNCSIIDELCPYEFTCDQCTLKYLYDKAKDQCRKIEDNE